MKWLLTIITFTLFGFINNKSKESFSDSYFFNQPSPDSTQNNTNKDTIHPKIVLKPEGKYADILKKAPTKKQAAKNNDSIQKQIFEDYLLNEIIPYWYKTEWDFNGYTNTPGKGKIACGYFVSTTLKHMGINIDRYKLAQQNPFNEARSLALRDSVYEFKMKAEDLKNEFIASFQEGVYFVGLDFHVGYLWFSNGELYFIHSNYINSAGVIFEYAIYSEAFLNTSTYWIAPLSTNNEFIQAWISSTPITVQTK